MSILLSDALLPIMATAQVYLLEGKFNRWVGPRTVVLTVLSRYFEEFMADQASSLSVLYIDVFKDYKKSHRAFKRGFVLLMASLTYACLFDDNKMRVDLWTAIQTLQLSVSAIQVATWMAGDDTALLGDASPAEESWWWSTKK